MRHHRNFATGCERDASRDFLEVRNGKKKTTIAPSRNGLRAATARDGDAPSSGTSPDRPTCPGRRSPSTGFTVNRGRRTHRSSPGRDVSHVVFTVCVIRSAADVACEVRTEYRPTRFTGGGGGDVSGPDRAHDRVRAASGRNRSFSIGRYRPVSVRLHRHARRYRVESTTSYKSINPPRVRRFAVRSTI